MMLNDEFWSERYRTDTTGWDLGDVSRPLKEYVDQVRNRDIQVLIPGCGNSYEAAYLLQQGFAKVTLADISEVLTSRLKNTFAKEIATGRCEVIHTDFFELKGSFDLVLEQTFFCAIDPSLRAAYAGKMSELLVKGGTLAGLLFSEKMPGGPPFGGTPEEYRGYFEPYFDFKVFEDCYNSVKPREGRELFMILKKK